ncbi:hypothetical protein GCM10023083_69080 [Streptomyces phyllanthi]
MSEIGLRERKKRPGPDGPGARVTVPEAGAVKGLEYDHVVAVEPAATAEERGRTGCMPC